MKKALDALRSLSISFDPEGQKISLSLQERELFTSGNLTQSLTQVFTSVGEAANKARKPICFFIDEMQYMEQEQMGSFIMALHRSNQKRYYQIR